MKRLPVVASVAAVLFFCVVLPNRSQAADGGIGLMIAQLYDSKAENRAGALIVLHVIDGMSAYQKGVRKGDIITHVNGSPTNGRPFEQLVSKELSGPVGSTVVLTIRRPPEEQPFDLKIVRVALPKSYGERSKRRGNCRPGKALG